MNKEQDTLENLYTLINLRIKEIEDKMLDTDSDIVLRHLQKALDHNKNILYGALIKDGNKEVIH